MRMGVDMRTASSYDAYETPASLVSEIRAYYGGFIDLDPCTSERNPTGALEYFTEADDGLSQPWSGNVYVNSPYGRKLPAWVDKCVVEVNHHTPGFTAEVIQLTPARMGSGWFKTAARAANGVLVLDKRLYFTVSGKPVVDKKGKPCTAQFDCALIHYGQNFQAFKKHFAKHGSFWAMLP